MKRGKQILVLLFLTGVFLAIGSVALWTAQREPVYDGKPLSQWATLYERSFWPNDPVIQTQARKAAHETRDQLVPYALKLMASESPWRSSLVVRLSLSKFSRRVPRSVWEWLQYDQGRISTTYFAMLGPDASPAVPEIVSLLKQTKSGRVSSRAIYALCYIGKEGQAPLAEILTDPACPYRRQIAYIVEDLKKEGVTVDDLVPALVKNLGDSDHNVVKATAYALGEMAIEPDIVVPGLTNCLKSTDIYVRGAALDALAKFHASARPALPALVAELDDPDSSVRKWATNAMRAVAPDGFLPTTNLVPVFFDQAGP